MCISLRNLLQEPDALLRPVAASGPTSACGKSSQHEEIVGMKYASVDMTKHHPPYLSRGLLLCSVAVALLHR
ncbi:hypothetical protein MUG91_G29n53 [Manis pentadactyla]|nr:hypothetical protein MUG91_G29n53 [Manis pentadactyla]